VIHRLCWSTLAALMLSACGGAAAPLDLGECPSDSLPLGEAPPLPGDACAEPPTPLGVAFEQAVEAGQAQSDANAAELLDPSTITVVTCGTGSPIGGARAQACIAVFAGGRFLLFDAGDRAQISMEDLGLPVTDLDAVFLTHFHSDHMADLGEVISRSWILGRTTPLPVYGGEAIDRVVYGFNLAYTPDEGYRREHHGETVFAEYAVLPAEAWRIEPPGPEGSVVYDEDGLVVRAFGVDYSPVEPSLGYRVEYGGRSVAISGDTVATEGLERLAEGADVLVSEVMDKGWTLEAACAMERLGDARNSKIFRDIRTYHIGVEELGTLARDAGVERLVLLHMVPAVPAAQAETLFGDPLRAVFDGEIGFADDGTRVTLDLD